MSNARHTPISNLNIVSVSGSSGGVLDKTEAHIHVQCDGGTVDEICRMLRAAPELLAALQAVSALDQDGMIVTGKPLVAAIDKARAAIAKAKGEQ